METMAMASQAPARASVNLSSIDASRLTSRRFLPERARFADRSAGSKCCSMSMGADFLAQSGWPGKRLGRSGSAGPRFLAKSSLALGSPPFAIALLGAQPFLERQIVVVAEILFGQSLQLVACRSTNFLRVVHQR